MKRIIVEGMDSTGKTTLVDKLLYEFHLLTRVVNTLGPEQRFDSWWLNEIRFPWGDRVPLHDRFFYSELVYGPVLRGSLKATKFTLGVVRESIRKEALLIYCRPSTQAIIETFEEKTQMDGVSGKKLTLLRVYDKLMNEEEEFYSDRLVRYNWQIPNDLHKVISKVERYLLESP